MNFYVVSVQGRKEESFLYLARKALQDADVEFFWPRRKLTIRRAGRKLETLAPLFAGYLFIATDELTDRIFRTLKGLPGFYRFLESNDRVRPLAGNDRELVAHFIRFGEVIGKSVVTFDENARIQVVSGPLAGMEGRVVHVDRRKGRAKVRLDLYQESFLVDFGFDVLNPATGGPSPD